MAFTHGHRAYEDDDEPVVTHIHEPKVTSAKYVSAAVARRMAQTQPEIPPCKYPVGTSLRVNTFGGYSEFVIKDASLRWVYSYDTPNLEIGGHDTPECWLDKYATIVAPDPYQVGTEHTVDFGVLGRLKVKIIERYNQNNTEWVVLHPLGVAESYPRVLFLNFEKAVVK